MRTSTISLAVLFCILLFVGLEIAAMCLYPGGTWWDRSAHGYRFWQNYLCDLEWTVALDGRPNLLGSRLAQGATLAFGVSFIPLWWLVAQGLAGRTSVRRAVHLLGWSAAAGLVAVSLMPTERFGGWHGVAVVAAGLPGTAALGLATAERLRYAGGRLFTEWLGAASCACSVVDLGLYVHTKWLGAAGSPLIPLLQKVALLMLLAWIASLMWKPTASVRDAVAYPERGL